MKLLSEKDYQALHDRIAELEQQVADLSKDKVRLDVLAKMWMSFYGCSKETLTENIDAFIPKEQGNG